jgi:hypothetical protein
MKIITATMAREIADDVMNNECAPFIKEVMDKILMRALMGAHFTVISYPKDMPLPAKENVASCFCNLGYRAVDKIYELELTW